MILHSHIFYYLCCDAAHGNVLTALVNITKEWRNLGLALGIKFHTIEEIEANNSQDVKKCLAKVVDSWLGGSGDQPSWSGLCNALRSELVKRTTVANEIQEKYIFND